MIVEHPRDVLPNPTYLYIVPEMKSNLALLWCLVLILVAGCSQQKQAEEPSKPEDVTVAPETAHTLPESLPERSCPNVNDGRASIAECRRLVDDAQKIVMDYRDLTVAEREGLIAAWREKERIWKAANDNLVQCCDLLLGADGTPVFPEIPLALERLNDADQSLVKSLAAATQSHRLKARSHVKSARDNLKRATRLLDRI